MFDFAMSRRSVAAFLFVALAASAVCSSALAVETVGDATAKVVWKVDKYPGPVFTRTVSNNEHRLVSERTVTAYSKIESFELSWKTVRQGDGRFRIDTTIKYLWDVVEEYTTVSEGICVSNMGQTRERKTGTVVLRVHEFKRYEGPGKSYTWNETFTPDMYPYPLVTLRAPVATAGPTTDANVVDAHVVLGGIEAATPAPEAWRKIEQTGTDPCGRSLASSADADLRTSFGPQYGPIGFIVPGLVRLPLENGPRVTFKFDKKSVRELYHSNALAVIEQLTLNFDVFDLPTPVTKISNLAPERGQAVTFDASASTGDYTKAWWHFRPDAEACTVPSVVTTDGPAKGLAAPDIKSYLKNKGVPDSYDFSVRERNQPDRHVHSTPLLCPVTAKLILEDDVSGIRASSEDVRINVVPRTGWATTARDQTAPTVTSVTGAAKEGTAAVSLGAFMDGKEAVALNVPAFCIVGSTYLRKDACRQEVFSNVGQQKFMKASAVSAVSDGHGGPPADIVLGDQGYRIKIAPAEGPFSGLYYFERVGDELFDRAILYNPNVALNANFKACIDLHERLHTQFWNSSLAFARNRGASGPQSGAFAPGAFDPKNVMEQMFDQSLLELLGRAGNVLTTMGFLSDSSDQEHTYMEHWQQWVTDPALVQQITTMKSDPPRPPGVVKTSALQGITCGGGNFPLSNP